MAQNPFLKFLPNFISWRGGCYSVLKTVMWPCALTKQRQSHAADSNSPKSKMVSNNARHLSAPLSCSKDGWYVFWGHLRLPALYRTALVWFRHIVTWLFSKRFDFHLHMQTAVNVFTAGVNLQVLAYDVCRMKSSYSIADSETLTISISYSKRWEAGGATGSINVP